MTSGGRWLGRERLVAEGSLAPWSGSQASATAQQTAPPLPPCAGDQEPRIGQQGRCPHTHSGRKASPTPSWADLSTLAEAASCANRLAMPSAHSLGAPDCDHPGPSISGVTVADPCYPHPSDHQQPQVLAGAPAAPTCSLSPPCSPLVWRCSAVSLAPVSTMSMSLD